MHRIFVGLILLSCTLTSILSAPCSGRLFYQSQDSFAIKWADVSNDDAGFISSGGSPLQSSTACVGGVASFGEVVCCPLNAKIRCWNGSDTYGSSYMLQAAFPSSAEAPYSLRINLDLKQVLLGSRYQVHTLTYANYWDDNSNPSWVLLASTSGRAWNIIPIAGVPFYHLIYLEQLQILRFNGTADTGKPIVTAGAVQSLTNINTESFALLSTTGSLMRWIEDGSTTAPPIATIPQATMTYANYNLTSAYHVGSCPYIILYSSSGVVTFAATTTATPSTVSGNIDSSVTFMTFALSPDVSGVVPPPLPPPEEPVSVPITVPVAAPEPTFAPEPISVPVAEPPSRNCTTPPPQPSNSFNCSNGVWVSNSSVTAPTIVASGSVVILSNLTVDNIVILGLNSNISVAGCVSINGSLTLQLTQEDLKSLTNKTVTLLNYAGCASATNLSAIPLNVVAPTKGCEKVSIATSGDSPTTLVAIVSFNNDPCKSTRNKPLIIGVSVAAGAVALGALGFALLVTCSSTVRQKVRPFSRPRQY